MSKASRERTILITGATGGLGKALALACARGGTRVVLLDRRRKPLEALCDQVEALGAPAPGYGEVDFERVGPDELSELVAGLTDAYGGIDGIAHCAVRFEGLRPLDQVPPQDWLKDLQVNLNAAWLLTINCLASLRERQGRVAFMVDGNASGKAYWGAYGVSKAALSSLAETLAEELEDSGCAVKTFDPGPMRTALRAAAYLAEDPATVPAPDEAAERVADWLLSSSGAGS